MSKTSGETRLGCLCHPRDRKARPTALQTLRLLPTVGGGAHPALVVGRQTYDDEDDRFYDALLAEEDVASDELLSGVLRNGMDF